MTTVILNEKPYQGKAERVCHICGENYYGWNFVRCGECEDKGGSVKVIRAYRGEV